MRSIQDLVSAEVRYCVSGLISTLARGYGAADRELEGICELAMELASPVPDYESAAREEGWKPFKRANGDMGFENAEAGERHVTAGLDWQRLCERKGIDPHESEVFEHWAVTDWFGEKLAAHGEKVETDFYGMTVWARTTTGQAIYADAVVERIYAELIAN